MADKEQPEGSLFDALGHSLRRKILQIMAADGEDMSPNRFYKLIEKSEPLSTISYHFKVLFENHAIKLTKKIPRRGAVEHFYKITVDQPWAKDALGLS